MLVRNAEAMVGILSRPLMLTMIPMLGKVAITTSNMHRMNITMTRNISNTMRSHTKNLTTRTATAILPNSMTRDLLHPRPVVRTSMMNVSTTKATKERHNPTVRDMATSVREDRKTDMCHPIYLWRRGQGQNVSKSYLACLVVATMWSAISCLRQQLTFTTARERILPAKPSSPTTISWDNPFPTFNTKKAEKKKHSSLDKDVAKLDLGPSPPRSSRPSTSQGNRRREEARPNTSHSQRAPDHRGPASPPIHQQPHMPMRKAPPPVQTDPHQEAYGSDPRYRPGLPPAEPMGQVFSRAGPPPDVQYDQMGPNQQAIANAEWGQEVIPPDVHYNGGSPDYSDPNYNYQRPERQRAQTARSPPVVPKTSMPMANNAPASSQTYVPAAVNVSRPPPSDMKVNTSGQGFEQPQNDMPNFDAIPRSASEREELHVQASQPEQPAYQKKAYQARAYQQPAAPISNAMPQGAYANGSVQSPIDQFQFGLPQSGPAPVKAGSQFPPRAASRPEQQPRSAATEQRMPFSNGPPQGRLIEVNPGGQIQVMLPRDRLMMQLMNRADTAQIP